MGTRQYFQKIFYKRDATIYCESYNVFFLNLISFFAAQKLKKTASKVAHNRPNFFFSSTNRPKSQFLFHKNLPSRDFSIMSKLPFTPTHIILNVCNMCIFLENKQFYLHFFCQFWSLWKTLTSCNKQTELILLNILLIILQPSSFLTPWLETF